MHTNLIDRRSIPVTAARIAGMTVLAVALLSSATAFAGQFTEYDGSGPMFQRPSAQGTLSTGSMLCVRDQVASSVEMMEWTAP